jgi:hypothetical protein
MTSGDREYFMLRTRQELEAAAHSSGAVRGRHEEFASAYRMRVMWIDRGLVDYAPAAPEATESAPVQRVIIPA